MGVVISSGVVLGVASDDIPLSHPRILWDSILRRTGATLTASTEEDGFAADNVKNGLTFDYWRPTALPATLEIELLTAEFVEGALIAAHDLFSNEARMLIEYWDGSAYQTWCEFAPGSDGVHMLLNERVFANKFQVTLDGDSIPSLGILDIGPVLAMERGASLDHAPIGLSKRSTVRPQLSENGKLLGRSVLRSGVATQLAFKDLSEAWLRENFAPFMESAIVYPFGLAWSPVNRPTEVAYCWTPSGKEDIAPQHADLPDFLNVAFDVEGIV